MPIHNLYFRDSAGNPVPKGLATFGPIEAVEVHVPDVIAQVLGQSNAPVPAPRNGIALFDTGASLTAVHEPALVELGLNPIGTVMTGTAGGTKQQSVYPGKLTFPGMKMEIAINQVTGVDLSKQFIPTPEGPQQLLVLVGRDILSECVFIYNGTFGTWTLSLG